MKSYKKTLSLLTVSLGVLLSAACAKKDSAGGVNMTPPPPPVGIAPNCTGCGGIGAGGVLGTVRGISPTSEAEIAADMYGDTTRFNPADQKAIIYYNGPVVMTAKLRLNMENFCRMPVGEYMLETIQPGMYASSMMSNVRMVATGINNLRVEMTMLQGVLYNAEDPNGLNLSSKTNRIYSQLRVDMVNGQPCGIIYSTY